MDNEKRVFQVPAVIISDSSMATGGRKFIIHTSENLPPEQLFKLINMKNKLGWVTFNVELIEATDLLDLPKIDKTRYTEGKSPQQRLRAVMFLLHKQNGGKDKDFPVVYESNIEKLITQYKEQLD